MGRRKLDPSGIENKEPPARVTVSLRRSDKAALEKLWMEEAPGEGFGSWLGERLASGLAFPASPSEVETVVLPDAAPAFSADGQMIARIVMDELAPELSDVLRRSAFKALEKVGADTARTMADAMTRATESAIGIAAHEASREAGRVVALTVAPEIRRVVALLESLTAPVVEVAPTSRVKH